MTKEEEAIENLKGMLEYKRQVYNMDTMRTEIVPALYDIDRKAIETVLNMLKEKDELYHKALGNLVKADRENIQLKKQIDLMAEEINETDRGYTDYCEMKIECDRNCKDCIKRYYERKSKEC